MRRRVVSRAVVLLLAALLLSPPAFAAGGRIPDREPGFLTILRQLLGSLVPPLAKGVGTIDPDGATADGTPSGDGEGVGTIDPNGQGGLSPGEGCSPAPAGDLFIFPPVSS